MSGADLQYVQPRGRPFFSTRRRDLVTAAVAAPLSAAVRWVVFEAESFVPELLMIPTILALPWLSDYVRPDSILGGRYGRPLIVAVVCGVSHGVTEWNATEALAFGALCAAVYSTTRIGAAHYLSTEHQMKRFH